MKIWLIWFWRMWKIIKQVALDRGHEISVISDTWNEISDKAEVYIDFSNAKWVLENSKKLCKLWLPSIIWTTWWYDQIEDVKKLFTNSWNTCIWSGNFSLWVNLLFSIVKDASKKIDKFNKDYDVMVHEYHHKNKIDSPWWTAIQIWNFILDNSSVKDKIVTEKLDRKIEENELHVSSTRGGDIPWIHNVTFDSKFDSINICHNARSREWFALWSVIAAENIKKIDPWFYNFPDIFNNLF